MNITFFNQHNEAISDRSFTAHHEPELQAFNENAYVETESFWESRVREIALDGAMISSHKVSIFEKVSVRTTGFTPLPGLIFTRKGRIKTFRRIQIYPGPSRTRSIISFTILMGPR